MSRHEQKMYPPRNYAELTVEIARIGDLDATALRALTTVMVAKPFNHRDLLQAVRSLLPA